MKISGNNLDMENNGLVCDGQVYMYKCDCCEQTFTDKDEFEEHKKMPGMFVDTALKE